MDDGWLLLALGALLAAMAATAAKAARRRLRRSVGFALGTVIGGASFAGLAGLALIVHVGPDAAGDAVRRAWQEVRPPLLPQVHRPTPLPPRAHRDAPDAGRLVGTVTWVRDGDTIEVGGMPIRFANVDCAEAGTPAGDRATAALRRMAAGRTVRCQLIGRRSFDREIGRCALEDGRDLGLALVHAGLCTMR
jgi:hypothetical protein